MPLTRRYFLFATLAIAIASLYLYQLNGFGVYGPDEPRYAAIGRAMAQTGDFVTPKLWGTPWFEKPPLLYWMTAFGTALGLGPDLCGRLPVAVLSLSSLAVWFELLRREFNWRVAGLSVCLLATSAWWLAFSGLCVTDLPLAVFFSFAVLLALPLLRAEPDTRHMLVRFAAMGACFGLAVLAKGLVPVALAVPFVWFLRRYWRGWLICLAMSGCCIALVFGGLLAKRLPVHPGLLHQTPFGTGVLGLVAPRSAALLLPVRFSCRRVSLDGPSRLVAASWSKLGRSQAIPHVGGRLGVVFFSIPLNKLPGYLLPLAAELFRTSRESFRTSTVERHFARLVVASALTRRVHTASRVGPSCFTGCRQSDRHQSRSLSRTKVFYLAVPLLIALLNPPLMGSLAAHPVRDTGRAVPESCNVPCHRCERFGSLAYGVRLRPLQMRSATEEPIAIGSTVSVIIAAQAFLPVMKASSPMHFARVAVVYRILTA